MTGIMPGFAEPDIVQCNIIAAPQNQLPRRTRTASAYKPAHRWQAGAVNAVANDLRRLACRGGFGTGIRLFNRSLTLFLVAWIATSNEFRLPH
jgi:hypothetical protein